MVVTVDSKSVVSYYAWCIASVALAHAPERLRKGVGRYPQPVALFARLGVGRLIAGAARIGHG